MGSRALGLAFVTVALVAGVPPAHAAFPGANGKIAFERTTTFCCPQPHVHVVNPDGTALTPITSGSSSRHPAWSPSGTRIAFVRGSTVMTVNATGADPQTVLTWPDAVGPLDWSPDGTQLAVELQVCDAERECRFDIHTVNLDASGLTNVTPDLIGDHNPSWSPDGTKIAFDSNKHGAEQDLYTVDVSGGGIARVTQHFNSDSDPDWSPDGQRLTFAANRYPGKWDIWRVNADGGGGVNITASNGDPEVDGDPAWSPDGRKIVWSRLVPSEFPPASCPEWELWTMNENGSEQTKLTVASPDDCTSDLDADWQPLPVNAYPRPKGASPVEFPLVPAYLPCTSPNGVHGPPLAHPSCAPPQREPGSLTVGTADSNGLPTKSVSIVRIGVLAGAPSTPEDEADLRLRGTVNDVRLAADLSDYTGQLEARVRLRITDKDNTPHPGGPGAATVQDLTYSFPIPCAATPDTTVGGDCTFDTTAETFVPGLVKELHRSVWELDQFAVHDGDGNPFMKQGIFVP